MLCAILPSALLITLATSGIDERMASPGAVISGFILPSAVGPLLEKLAILLT